MQKERAKVRKKRAKAGGRMQMEHRKKIRIIEVGPRDGFQNVKTFIDTETKLLIIEGLYQSGIRTMEVTSFVSPRAIPQMADAADVAQAVISRYQDLRAIALIPNLKGAQNAWNAGIREAACVISASEAHNRANINRTIKESLETLEGIRKALPDLEVHLDAATAFGCPFAGEVPEAAVLSLIGSAQQLGIDKVTLCDTIGVANPVQVKELLCEVTGRYPGLELTLHFHNTRGMGLANIFAATEMGIRNFETSVGGLGGCPFAPGADGNTATEDTVHMLEKMGYDTGIDLTKLLGVVEYVGRHVDAPVTGKMLGVVNSTCENVSGRA